MVGAGLSVAFAVGTPILIFGGALSVVGLLVSVFTQKSVDQVMAEKLESQWGASGLLREGWREALTQWFVDHQPEGTGMGMDA